MALTLIVEDGTGLANANTYVSLGDALAYCETSLYASAFTSATTDNQNRALASATRLLDQNYQWNGYKATETQALQWPRTDVEDPDREDEEIASNVVPVAIKNGVCEYAIWLMSNNPSANPQGEGIQRFELSGVMEVEFNAATNKPVVPAAIGAELKKYGRKTSGGSGSVKLTRV